MIKLLILFIFAVIAVMAIGVILAQNNHYQVCASLCEEVNSTSFGLVKINSTVEPIRCACENGELVLYKGDLE